MRRSLVLAAILGALALLVGCGGSSKEDYIDAVREAAKPITETQDEGLAISQAQSADEIASLLSDVIEIYDEAIADLDDIEPPDDIGDTHDRFVGVLTELRDLYANLKERADAGELTSLPADFEDELQGALTEFTEIGAEYEDKGYDLSQGGD